MKAYVYLPVRVVLSLLCCVHGRGELLYLPDSVRLVRLYVTGSVRFGAKFRIMQIKHMLLHALPPPPKKKHTI